ncbi:MAG: hypothetical protein OEY93_02540 [Anaerolineae bacterium]|nr:hypothetical protein [Anaerolineae bacterium]
MKVYIDRNHCTVHQSACESCFGGRIEVHFTGSSSTSSLEVAGCVMEIDEEDDLKNITFFIQDRNGMDKILKVDENNWPEAYDSWIRLYEKQSHKI